VPLGLGATVMLRRKGPETPAFLYSELVKSTEMPTKNGLKATLFLCIRANAVALEVDAACLAPASRMRYAWGQYFGPLKLFQFCGIFTSEEFYLEEAI